MTTVRRARRQAARRLGVLVAVAGLVWGCAAGNPGTSSGVVSSPGASPETPTITPAAPTLDATQSPTATPQAPAPDLSARPLTWFAPLPPMPGRTGSTDFMAQFELDAPWAAAADRVQVYKLYGEWVAYHATPDELRRAVQDIRRRGMVLAVEAGPLDPTADCGSGVESFAGVEEGRRIAARIEAAGGRIDILALDEPYFYAHVYDGPNACHWSIETIAAGVVAYREAMRDIFPTLLIGDTEPLPAPVSATGMTDWLDAYRVAGGEPFAFLHLDADWGRPGWAELSQDIATRARDRGVPIGMIYNGGSVSDRATWIGQAGERVRTFEAAGAPPDHVLFQSWNLQPDRALPDTDPTSFSGLVRRYFESHEALGFATEGSGANLALRRTATASATLPGSSAGAAVDGDYDTLWSSGGGPVQWIEVDLGGTRTVAEIRLTVDQYPAGATDHRMYGRMADGSLKLLHRFQGVTESGMTLAFAPTSPWTGIRAVRVETRSSPSWVAWKEIGVLAP